MTEDIPILQKTYDLYKLFYQYSLNFPKKDRFGIGRRCENQIMDLMESLIKASKTQRENKRTQLYDISTQLDTLKIFIRLMKELAILDIKKYTQIQQYIQEIGKMLGGWIKSLN
jgi:hypothetical protein